MGRGVGLFYCIFSVNAEAFQGRGRNSAPESWERGRGTAGLPGSLVCSSDGENPNSSSTPMRIPRSPGFSDDLGNCP